jgi:hypothetical protein
MKTFTDYNNALTYARDLATQCKRDAGIEKAKEFNRTVFSVFLLPAPAFRTGRELRCETVAPETPQTHTA